jgi:repressor LexA
MTPRQSATLDFVRDFWEEHNFSPSYDEIREGIGLKSKSGVWFLLNALEQQGYVVRTFNESRSVTPVEFLPVKKKKPKETKKLPDQSHNVRPEKTAKILPWGA